MGETGDFYKLYNKHVVTFHKTETLLSLLTVNGPIIMYQIQIRSHSVHYY